MPPSGPPSGPPPGMNMGQPPAVMPNMMNPRGQPAAVMPNMVNNYYNFNTSIVVSCVKYINVTYDWLLFG